MFYPRILACMALCLAAHSVPAEQNLSAEQGRWTDSNIADEFAECAVFFNSMSIWPGMTEEASLQLADLADASTRQLVEVVDGETAVAKMDAASDVMWAPYAGQTGAVSPSEFITRYTAKCARLLSEAEIALVDVKKEGDRRFPG